MEFVDNMTANDHTSILLLSIGNGCCIDVWVRMVWIPGPVLSFNLSGRVYKMIPIQTLAAAERLDLHLVRKGNTSKTAFQLYFTVRLLLNCYFFIKYIYIYSNILKDICVINKIKMHHHCHVPPPQWMNDIESDPMYRSWPSGIQELLRATFPGVIRQIRRNFFNLVRSPTTASCRSTALKRCCRGNAA